MANKLGTVFVELSLDDKTFKQKLSETLTSTQATTRGIETSWRALGTKSEAVFDSQRKAVENAYTLIKNSASSTANDIVRAEEAKNAKIKALNEQQFGHQTSLLESIKKHWMAIAGIATAIIYTATKVYNLGKNTAAAADETLRMSKIYEMTTTQFQEFRYVAMRADVSIEGLARGMRNLSRAIGDMSKGTGEGAETLKAIGINIYDVTGQTRSLNEIMGDIADKFASWREGPEKIAIALKLFGKSGEEMIPMLNRGRLGLEEFKKEFERLGIAISKEQLEKLAKADEAFERFGARLQKLKTEILVPLVDWFGRLIDKITEVTAAATGEAQIRKEMEKARQWMDYAMKEGAWKTYESWEREYYRLSEKLYGISPELLRGGAKLEPEKISPPTIKPLDEEFKQGIEYAKLMYESWKEDYYGYYDELYTAQIKAHEEREFWMNEEVRWKKLQVDEETEAIREGLENAKDLYDFWLDERKIQIEAEEEIIAEGIERARNLHAEWMEEYIKNTADVVDIGQTLAQNMASAWNFNIKNIIRDSENMGDVIKNVFLGMADAFSSAVSRMVSDWMFFGSITGKYESGKGIIGIIGGGLSGLFGGAAAAPAPAFEWGYMQKGGTFWTQGPTPLIVGEGREREFVSITPESKMGREKKGGDTYNYYIDARGAQRGVSAEIKRALRETENRAVNRSISQVADNKMRGGKYGKIFER